MFLQDIAIGFRIVFQDAEELLAELFRLQNRAEGAMEDLSAGLDEASGDFHIFPSLEIYFFNVDIGFECSGRGRFLQRRRDMVRRTIGFISRPREIHNLAKQLRIVSSNYAER